MGNRQPNREQWSSAKRLARASSWAGSRGRKSAPAPSTTTLDAASGSHGNAVVHEDASGRPAACAVDDTPVGAPPRSDVGALAGGGSGGVTSGGQADGARANGDAVAAAAATTTAPARSGGDEEKAHAVATPPRRHSRYSAAATAFAAVGATPSSTPVHDADASKSESDEVAADAPDRSPADTSTAFQGAQKASTSELVDRKLLALAKRLQQEQAALARPLAEFDSRALAAHPELVEEVRLRVELARRWHASSTAAASALQVLETRVRNKQRLAAWLDSQHRDKQGALQAADCTNSVLRKHLVQLEARLALYESRISIS